jgi:hypothetical protein
MKLYLYTAILHKQVLVQGKVTFTDKQASAGRPLDSQCVQGYVAADHPKTATKHATDEVKQQYPSEQGYKQHENVRVEYVQEYLVPTL